MTNLDPKHLDALVERVMKISMDLGFPSTTTMDSALARELCATITALRAQIDRDRAATIEAAGLAVADTEIGFYDGISGDWRAYTGPVILSKACASIRALHTDDTRAAMDAIRREGYEAGVKEARQLCAMVEQRTKPGNAHEAMIFHLGFTEGRKGCEMAIAASIPSDPDTTPRK